MNPAPRGRLIASRCERCRMIGALAAALHRGGAASRAPRPARARAGPAAAAGTGRRRRRRPPPPPPADWTRRAAQPGRLELSATRRGASSAIFERRRRPGLRARAAQPADRISLVRSGARPAPRSSSGPLMASAGCRPRRIAARSRRARRRRSAARPDRVQPRPLPGPGGGRADADRCRPGPSRRG